MEESSLAPAYQAKNFIEAQLVKGLLETEGLHPIVPGDSLNDEFGVAARMAGTSGTTVVVPRGELAQAQAIVAAWQSAAEEY